MKIKVNGEEKKIELDQENAYYLQR